MYRALIYGTFLTLLLIAGSILYIAKKAINKEVIGLLFHLDKKYLLLSVLSMFAYHTFDNLRIYVLARALRFRYSFLYGYVVSVINTFGATITPAHTGGELMSLYTLSRKKGKLHKVASIVTVKTITGAFFFLLALPYALYTFYENPSQAKKLLGVFAFFLLLFVCFYLIARLFFKKAKNSKGPTLKKLVYNLKKYLVNLRLFWKVGKASLIGACIFSVALYISFLTSGAFLVKSFNPDASLLEAIKSQLLLLYAIFISPTPGGVGVGEVGALYAFEGLVDFYVLGAFSLLWRFITQYFSALLGGVAFGIMVFIDVCRYRLR